MTRITPDERDFLNAWSMHGGAGVVQKIDARFWQILDGRLHPKLFDTKQAAMEAARNLALAISHRD